MAKYKVSVDRSKCIGCQACVIIAPEVFEIGEGGRSHAKQEIIDDSLYEKAKEAQNACPTGAISIEKIED